MKWPYLLNFWKSILKKRYSEIQIIAPPGEERSSFLLKRAFPQPGERCSSARRTISDKRAAQRCRLTNAECSTLHHISCAQQPRDSLRPAFMRSAHHVAAIKVRHCSPAHRLVIRQDRVSLDQPENASCPYLVRGDVFIVGLHAKRFDCKNSSLSQARRSHNRLAMQNHLQES